MIEEFRKFIMRGNVIDLAVGIVIGAAFTSIVNALVNNVIMPPIGWIIGGLDFSQISIVLGTNAAGEQVVIGIGVFINAVINFSIVALAMFLVIKAFNTLQERMTKKAAVEAVTAPPEPTAEEKLLAAIEKLNATIDRKM